MKLLKLHVFALAGLVALTACEREADDDDDIGTDTTLDTLARMDADRDLPTDPVVTGLDDVNDSGIDGEATATHSAQEVTVSLLLKDRARANVTYPAHIHSGNCKDGGPVAVELEPVKNLQSSKTISLASLKEDQSYFIQVHDPSGKPVACGDMKGHEGHDRNMMRDSAHRGMTTTR